MASTAASTRLLIIVSLCVGGGVLGQYDDIPFGGGGVPDMAGGKLKHGACLRQCLDQLSGCSSDPVCQVDAIQC